MDGERNTATVFSPAASPVPHASPGSNATLAVRSAAPRRDECEGRGSQFHPASNARDNAPASATCKPAWWPNSQETDRVPVVGGSISCTMRRRVDGGSGDGRRLLSRSSNVSNGVFMLNLLSRVVAARPQAPADSGKLSCSVTHPSRSQSAETSVRPRSST